jgi:hypothetical protein
VIEFKGAKKRQELKANLIITGPVFPESIQVMMTITWEASSRRSARVCGGEMSIRALMPTLLSQLAQIVRHVAALPDHLHLAETCCRRIKAAAECECSDISWLLGERLRPHHGGTRVKAFHPLRRYYAAVGSDEGHSDVIGLFGLSNPL